jgi:hypothetical protein
VLGADLGDATDRPDADRQELDRRLYRPLLRNTREGERSLALSILVAAGLD